MSSTRHRASRCSQNGLDQPGSACCRDRPRVMLSIHLSVHTSTLMCRAQAVLSRAQGSSHLPAGTHRSFPELCSHSQAVGLEKGFI